MQINQFITRPFIVSAVGNKATPTLTRSRPSRPQLVSKWVKENGKLVCRWQVTDQSNPTLS